MVAMQSAHRSRAAAAFAVLAAAAVALLVPPTAARTLPDPCFACMEQTACASPPPLPGTEFQLVIEGSPKASTQPGGSLLDQLSAQHRTFTLRHMQDAFMDVQGKRVLLGSFAEAKSNGTVHVFENPEPPSSADVKAPRFQAVVEFRCNERATEEKLVRVMASSDAEGEHTARARGRPATITFTFLMPSTRLCGMPPCAAQGSPLTVGEYLIYRPPLVRQECPGVFLSSPSCKSGRDELGLAPLGRLGSRQRWLVSATPASDPAAAAAVAAGDGIEDDLLGQPVLIQNVGRSARACASHLSPGGSRECAAGAGAATVAHAAERWVLEPGPPSPAGVVVSSYYLRAQGLLEAGCDRAYLCIKLTCDSPQVQLCSKDEAGHSSLWMVRPADVSATLARVWGLS